MLEISNSENRLHYFVKEMGYQCDLKDFYKSTKIGQNLSFFIVTDVQTIFFTDSELH